MRRRTTTAALVVLLVLLAVLAPQAAASGGEHPVQLSPDGSHWAAELTAPLFDPSVLWVPGDVRTASFYVANHGPTPASVALRVRTVADTLVDPGRVQLQARVDGTTWREVVPAAGTDTLNPVALEVADVSRVDVRARFRSAAGNATQSASVRLGFAVDLGEAPPVPGPDHLPGTGAPLLRGPLLLAGLLLGAGAALVRRASRTRQVRRG